MMRTTFSIFILFGSLVALFVIVQSTMRVRTGDASVAPPAQGAAPPVEAVAPPARMAERLRDPSAQREPARFSSPTCAGDLATGEPKSRSAADIQADNERLAVVQTALLEIQKQQADDKAAVNANAKILDHSFEDSSSEIGAAAAPGAAELEKPVAGPEPPKETPPPVADAKENEVPKETVPGEPGRLPTGPPVVKTTEAELTPTMIALREKLRDTLAAYHQRPENVAARSPWGAMHAMIAYGVDAELIAGFQRVNAIGWLCYNGNCNNQTLFWTQNGKLQTKIGPGVQGHAGQFLSMLAQSRVKTDYPLVVDGRKFTVADLIEYEKLTCQTRTELTFKLIALSHYLKSNETWRAQDGQAWDIPRLIQEELSQPIIGAACGGTHRLTGFAYAVRKRQQRGEPIDGQWLRAEKYLDEYHNYTFNLQNPDGSFSTNWFVGRQDEGAAAKRLETTGHTTEWLAFSLSQHDLRDPRMVKAVSYLVNLLWNGRNEKWNIGPMGHGLHALSLYDERVFGGKPGDRKVELTRVPQTARWK